LETDRKAYPVRPRPTGHPDGHRGFAQHVLPEKRGRDHGRGGLGVTVTIERFGGDSTSPPEHRDGPQSPATVGPRRRSRTPSRIFKEGVRKPPRAELARAALGFVSPTPRPSNRPPSTRWRREGHAPQPARPVGVETNGVCRWAAGERGPTANLGGRPDGGSSGAV